MSRQAGAATVRGNPTAERLLARLTSREKLSYVWIAPLLDGAATITRLRAAIVSGRSE